MPPRSICPTTAESEYSVLQLPAAPLWTAVPPPHDNIRVFPRTFPQKQDMRQGTDLGQATLNPILLIHEKCAADGNHDRNDQQNPDL